MADVRLSARARVDLEEIRADGAERFGVEVAERHLEKIGEVLSLLSDHPMAGPARPEFSGNIRAISCRPRRMLYTVNGEVVRIVRIIHQARDVRRAL